MALKSIRIELLVALATAVGGVVFSLAVANNRLIELAVDSIAFSGFWLWTLAVIPFAYMLPRRRKSSVGLGPHYPSATYCWPRWIVRCGIGMLIGQAVAAFVLAAVADRRFALLGGSLGLLAVAFCAGARERLKKPACSEWNAPLWPFRVHRWMRR